MVTAFRLPNVTRGVPARLGAVLMVAAAVGGWAMWPEVTATGTPPALTMDGKHTDRLAFAGDESEIPVRESRIYDTIAMFAQPQAEPRMWSEAPVPATVQEAGIRLIPLRPAPTQRVAVAKPATIAKPVRTAAAEPARPKAIEAATPVSVFGWAVPGSEHLPTRRDAFQVFDKVGSGAQALGSGTVKAVSRTASALGDGVSSAGGAIADRLGL